MQDYRDWTPIKDIPHVLWVDAIHDDVEGLRFLLRGSDPTSPTLRLLFEAVIGYRNINESFRLGTWATISDIKQLPSLMIIDNSKWVRWLIEEAGGVLRPESLTHYAIYTPEDCIDVVTEFPPDVRWLNKP